MNHDLEHHSACPLLCDFCHSNAVDIQSLKHRLKTTYLVRKSWIPSGLGRLGTFFRSFRNLRMFFLIEPMSNAIRLSLHELSDGELAYEVGGKLGDDVR
jgi:hypothetical protein